MVASSSLRTRRAPGSGRALSHELRVMSSGSRATDLPDRWGNQGARRMRRAARCATVHLNRPTGGHNMSTVDLTNESSTSTRNVDALAVIDVQAGDALSPLAGTWEVDPTHS